MKLRVAAPFDAVSGKVGGNEGVVGYLIRGRQVGRDMVRPTNPDTSPQQNIRTIFSSISNQYKSISGAQETDWSNLADNFTLIDPLGAEYKPYTNNAYMLVNLYRQLDAQAITDVAPAFSARPAVTSIDQAEVVGGNLQITISHNLTTGGGADLVFVRVTPSLGSARRKARQNEYRILTDPTNESITAATASPQTVVLAMDNFTLAAEEYLGIEVRTLSSVYVPGGVLRDANHQIIP